MGVSDLPIPRAPPYLARRCKLRVLFLSDLSTYSAKVGKKKFVAAERAVELRNLTYDVVRMVVFFFVLNQRLLRDLCTLFVWWYG